MVREGSQSDPPVSRLAVRGHGGADGTLLVGASNLCLELDRHFRLLDRPGEELLDASVVIVDISMKQALRLADRKKEALDLLKHPNALISSIAARPEATLWVTDFTDRRLRIYTAEGQLVDSIIPLSSVRLLGPEGTSTLASAVVALDATSGLIYLGDPEILKRQQELRGLFTDRESPGSGLRKSIAIRAVSIEDLFPSLLQRYRSAPVGSVKPGGASAGSARPGGASARGTADSEPPLIRDAGE